MLRNRKGCEATHDGLRIEGCVIVFMVAKLEISGRLLSMYYLYEKPMELSVSGWYLWLGALVSEDGLMRQSR